MVFTGCWTGIWFVTGGICVSGLLVYLVQRLFPEAVLRTGHDATGNLLSIVGTLYAVLLGLIVVVPWLGHSSWHAYRALVEPPARGAAR
jgi:hypothetical protein